MFASCEVLSLFFALIFIMVCIYGKFVFSLLLILFWSKLYFIDLCFVIFENKSESVFLYIVLQSNLAVENTSVFIINSVLNCSKYNIKKGNIDLFNISNFAMSVKCVSEHPTITTAVDSASSQS